MDDLFERAEKIQKRIDKLTQERDRLAAHADMQLLLADVAAVLRKVDTRHMGEGTRIQLAGVRKRVFEKLRDSA